MDVSKPDLDQAVADQIITAVQADRLWAAWSARADQPAPKAKFDLLHIAYYFGALLVIGAMGWFMTLAWESLGGPGIFAIATGYTLLFVFTGRALWKKPGLEVPGGLLITMAVCMTPLATYGLERWIGIWPDSDPGAYRDFHTYVKGGWLWMELETILAALLAMRFVRFPFLSAPLAFTLWYMSMDLAPILFGKALDWNGRAEVSAAVGAVMLLVGYLVDRRTRADFAFWLYLFGMFAFWGGMSSMSSDSELNKFVYFLINLALIGIGPLLGRRVFVVFGALGVMGYITYLSHRVFKDSIAFPFVLSFIGILILFVAVKYAKNRESIDRAVMNRVPAWLRKRLPKARVPA
jgi:hypothetical protein